MNLINESELFAHTGQTIPEAVIGVRSEIYVYSLILSEHMASCGWNNPEYISVGNDAIEYDFDSIEIVIDVYDGFNIHKFPTNIYSNVWIDYRTFQYGIYNPQFVLNALQQFGVREYTLFIPEVKICKQLYTSRLS